MELGPETDNATEHTGISKVWYYLFNLSVGTCDVDMREVSCRPVRSEEEMLTGAPRCNLILTFLSRSIPGTKRKEGRHVSSKAWKMEKTDTDTTLGHVHLNKNPSVFQRLSHKVITPNWKNSIELSAPQRINII